jgi:hypothetical protein
LLRLSTRPALGLRMPAHQTSGLSEVPLYRRDAGLPKLPAQAAVLSRKSEAWPFGPALGRKCNGDGFPAKDGNRRGRGQYRRRSQVAEFAHAWIKSKLGLRQFHLRGLLKVQIEMLWACLSYNLQHWIRLRKLQPAPVIT